jgi:hypothetical protein
LSSFFSIAACVRARIFALAVEHGRRRRCYLPAALPPQRRKPLTRRLVPSEPRLLAGGRLGLVLSVELKKLLSLG